jgi:excisionase family DNA binding protein
MVDRPRNMVEVEVTIPESELNRIALRLADLLAVARPTVEPWLDIDDAASHVALSPNAVRALVKRHRIPFHRTEHGRLRFSPTELDDWVRTGSCAATQEDLP